MVDFTKNYINECVKQNKNTLAEIIAMAQTEIKEIDEEVKQLEGRRNRQINLRALLRQLGAQHEPKTNVISENISVTENDNPYIKTLAIQICKFLDIKDPVTTRDILDEIGTPAENKAALLAIKYLWDSKIVHRDDVRKNITKGERWDQRPIDQSN